MNCQLKLSHQAAVADTVLEELLCRESWTFDEKEERDVRRGKVAGFFGNMYRTYACTLDILNDIVHDRATYRIKCTEMTSWHLTSIYDMIFSSKFQAQSRLASHADRLLHSPLGVPWVGRRFYINLPALELEFRVTIAVLQNEVWSAFVALDFVRFLLAVFMVLLYGIRPGWWSQTSLTTWPIGCPGASQVSCGMAPKVILMLVASFLQNISTFQTSNTWQYLSTERW